MIECIPNFSEGRRREVIDAIASAIAEVPGAAVLDTSADADHNRSVITFAGPAEAVAEAAFRAVRKASELIDLNEHRGEHPRVGATDVLPFVPLRGATLEECVALARAVGRRIGEELGIPVYLYEAAATRPERAALPNLRRGEYEGLREAIARDPDRAPDFGPPRLGPAGATIVGARQPLIAYNVYLNTGDVRIANRIAKAIRGSSGGLRGVRALGLLVDGRAQVSMNLVDYTTTPIHRAVEMIAREAAAYGALVVESELVGLIPEDALLDAARFYLRLHNMHEDQVLERRLIQAEERGTSSEERGMAAAEQSSDVEKAVSSWTLTTRALGAAACEMAEARMGEPREGLMLAALGRELLALAEQPDAADSPRAAARALLLVAERSVKVAEIAAGHGAAGDLGRASASTMAQLAHALAAGAQARSAALLPQIADEELRANFSREFAAHVEQAGELVAKTRSFHTIIHA
jgi:glutamate formiminotransferase